MKFGVLGPVALIVDSKPYELTSPNSRKLLATLILRAGTTVPTAALAWELWGLEQPANPRRATQLAVTRLRTLLARHNLHGLLRTRADGYLLDVAIEDIDLGVFMAALRDAEVARRSSQPDQELRAIERALTTWRGDALADVSMDALVAERVRLDERRLQAVERRNEILLAGECSQELLGELRELTLRHPTRERFWLQHLRALHAAGRRSEALAEYEVLRRRLATEFGTEPSPELGALHIVLLRGDAGDVGRGVGRVPRQLPCPPANFVGREREIERLTALVPSPKASAPVLALVTGLRGTGKSALVGHWARRMADVFPDGQIWINLRGYDARAPMRPEEALGRLLRSLGVHRTEVPELMDERAAMLRSCVDGLRVLLVLDNARNAAQIGPLLPGAGGAMVVATSRSPLSALTCATGASAVRLNSLTDEDARQLVVRLVGTDRIESADEIIANCGGLPLSLLAMAGRFASPKTLSSSAVAAEWNDELRVGGFNHFDVA